MKYLQKIIDGNDLSINEAQEALHYIFDTATDAQIAALLTALRMKGEAVSEIAGLAKGMREASIKISPNVSGTLVDTCGTGGDGSNTINVSTAAALLCAACGVPVAKHGNYAMSSRCGSANVLEELGVEIKTTPAEVQEAIETVGLGFMLAPLFHPSMKRVAPIRREMGVRTVFNVLGPLTNPAGAKAQLIGVYDSRLCEKLAEVLMLLGSKRAMVVHGSGMDEITNTGSTFISELKDDEVVSYTIRPEDLGYSSARPEDIAGGDPLDNARVLVDILKGSKGPASDIVAMNAGAAIYVSGLEPTLKRGCERAEEALSSGDGLSMLQRLVEYKGQMSKLERFL